VVANAYDFEDRLRSYELLANLTKQTEETTRGAASVRA
jgi:hypothetical protein